MSFVPIVGCTGFEAGNIQIISSSNRNNCSISTTKHSGAYSLFIDAPANNTAYARFPVSGVGNELYIRAWVYPDRGDYFEFAVYGGGQWVGLRFDGSHWDAYVNGSKVADGSLEHTEKSWHSVGLHVIIDNSGTIESLLDGTVDISYNGDTYASGSSDITWVRFYSDAPTYVVARSYVDDLVMGTGAWPPDINFAAALKPDGDTAQLDWTPSTGSVNWDLVDDVPPSDAEYVSSGSTGYKDLYTLSDWSAGANESAVFIVDWLRAKKESADSTMIRSVIKSGASESSGDPLDLSTSFSYHSRILTTDPSTGSSWTESGINALEIGQEYV